MSIIFNGLKSEDNPRRKGCFKILQYSLNNKITQNEVSEKTSNDPIVFPPQITERKQTLSLDLSGGYQKC